MGRAQFLLSSFVQLETDIAAINASVGTVETATSGLEAKIDAIGDGYRPAAASNTIQANSAAVKTKTVSNTKQKFKEFKIVRPGTIRVNAQ
jgi:hypothetical protein